MEIDFSIMPTSIESEIMELGLELSTLEITHKKRRLSGVMKRMAAMQVDTTSAKSCEEFNKTPKEDDYTSSSESKNEDPSAALRRSSRKRSATAFWDGSLKAAAEKTIAPVKALNLEENPKEIEKLYLNRSIKRLNPSLETIFEVPENQVLMSSRKFKRMLCFNGNNIQNKSKTKKRLLKAKKITKCITKKKITMSFLMQKLADIESE